MLYQENKANQNETIIIFFKMNFKIKFDCPKLFDYQKSCKHHNQKINVENIIL